MATNMSVVVPGYGYDQQFSEEIHHQWHQGHMLRRTPHDGVRYVCSLCDAEIAAGAERYECGHGAFCGAVDKPKFHVECAVAPVSRWIRDVNFDLVHSTNTTSNPAAGCRRCRTICCDACGDPATGFVYRSRDDDLGGGAHNVHPSCAASLTECFSSPEPGGGWLSFQLQMEPPPRRNKCALCECDCGKIGKRTLWSYRCDLGDGGKPLFFHVACVKQTSQLGFPNSTNPNPRLHVGHYAAGNYFLHTLDSSSSFAAYHGGGQVVVVHHHHHHLLRVQQPQLQEKKKKNKLERSLKVIGFITRVVIGIIFGDPTAMFIGVATLLFS